MDHALDEIKDKIHPDKKDEKMKTFDPEKLHPRAFFIHFFRHHGTETNRLGFILK